MFVYYLFIIYHVPKFRFNTACIIKQSFFWWWYGVLNKRNIDRFCFLEMGSLVECAPTTVKLLSHLAKCALKFSWIIRLACLFSDFTHWKSCICHAQWLHWKGQFVKLTLFWISINLNAQIKITGFSQFHPLLSSSHSSSILYFGFIR